MTTANPGDESRDRVTVCLISSVPGLEDGAVRDVLVAAGAGHGRALREMDSLLEEHPGALVMTPASYPLALVRLAHALIEAGYLTVAVPACAGCGKITADLRRKTASGRVCGACAARDSKGTCARCGQAKRIYARRPEGGICSACYDKDEQVVTECSGCGRMRRAAARMPDGSARCQFCATRPVRTCSACGQQRTVAGTTDAGPVCCFGCVLAERAHALLAGPSGEVPAQLHPLFAALTTVTNPATEVTWLGKSRSAQLLGSLARTGNPITHDLLDDLPQSQALRYIRDMLVSSGVLPARNEHLERLAPWLEHLLDDKPAHHARLIRPFAHWFVLRRARRAAASRTFTRGSADFARARILVALDLLSWLDQRAQDLRDLTQADLDRWLTGGTTTRLAVRYFLHWAHGRGLVSDLSVPLPPRQEPERLLAEDDHIHQLDRCLTDEAMPLDLRVGGALVLLFGMLVSRITRLAKDDVIEDSQATWLAIDGHRLMLPARLAHLVRQLRDQDEQRWTLGRLGTPVPWLFPGQSPARPAVDILFGVRLRQYGINAHAGRNTARLALAAELPASVLADPTGISVGTAERWSQWAKRDWAAYVGQRTADDRSGIGSRKLANPTR